ncbi:MAG: sugar phosphate nucleotidyltransferase [Bacillota bacterium]
MKLVLLSGGSGSRLWPLSNDIRSKQFLKLLENKNGESESMVQRVWSQLKENNLENDAIIATSANQIEALQSQLNDDVKIVIEPSRRDTFPAIALAVSYIKDKVIHNEDEVIVVLPVDPYVSSSFFHKVTELEEVIRNSDYDLALIGVHPTLPTSKYGYIVPEVCDEASKNYLRVDKFKEKPDLDTATELIANGALWNCGVFAFKMSYLLRILEEKKISHGYENMMNNYNELPQISFDYEVVENAEKIAVLPYKGFWKDLGTWNTLTEEMTQNKLGNGVISQDSINTHLINELDIPITIIGANDLVVAASPDGILVSNKESSPKIKDMVKELKTRPMFEERRWGWYKILENIKYSEGNEVITKKVCIQKGKNLSYQIHHARSEVWTILKGQGEIVIDNNLYQVSPGSVIEIPIATKHAIKAITDIELIEIQSGSHLIEEDIIRLEYQWDNILEICKQKLEV